jgi:putative PIN family toxin of toxin-antitoxin system
MNAIPTVVFDCMIYAQALISPRGPAAVCLDHACRGNLHLVWSDYTLQEIRELPSKLPPRLKVTSERVEAFILAVAPHVEYVDAVPETYVNPFDCDDSHYVNLAAAAKAKLITSRDGDLLRLMDMGRREGKEFHRLFPEIQIMTPEFLLGLLKQNIGP